MFIGFILLAFICESYGHTYGNMQMQGIPDNAFVMQHNGQPMMARIQTTTTQQRCCWMKKCRNGICQESYKCGDSCPAPNMQPNWNSQPNWNIQQNPMQGRRNYAPVEQPNTRITCCIVQQCNPGGGECQQTFTCGEKCTAGIAQQPRETEAVQPEYRPPSETPLKLQNTTPRPYFPGRNPVNNNNNMDITPEFEPLPGVFLDEEKPKTTTTRSTSTTTKKPEKCEDGKVHFPNNEDDEDFGPTPGYDLKHEYMRNKCDNKECKIVTVKCGKCPDPFDPQFRLYKVRRECFKCYEISCTLPTPK